MDKSAISNLFQGFSPKEVKSGLPDVASLFKMSMSGLLSPFPDTPKVNEGLPYQITQMNKMGAGLDNMRDQLHAEGVWKMRQHPNVTAFQEAEAEKGPESWFVRVGNYNAHRDAYDQAVILARDNRIAFDASWKQVSEEQAFGQIYIDPSTDKPIPKGEGRFLTIEDIFRGASFGLGLKDGRPEMFVPPETTDPYAFRDEIKLLLDSLGSKTKETPFRERLDGSIGGLLFDETVLPDGTIATETFRLQTEVISNLEQMEALMGNLYGSLSTPARRSIAQEFYQLQQQGSELRHTIEMEDGSTEVVVADTPEKYAYLRARGMAAHMFDYTVREKIVNRELMISETPKPLKDQSVFTMLVDMTRRYGYSFNPLVFRTDEEGVLRGEHVFSPGYDIRRSPFKGYKTSPPLRRKLENMLLGHPGARGGDLGASEVGDGVPLRSLGINQAVTLQHGWVNLGPDASIYSIGSKVAILPKYKRDQNGRFINEVEYRTTFDGTEEVDSQLYFSVTLRYETARKLRQNVTGAFAKELDVEVKDEAEAKDAAYAYEDDTKVRKRALKRGEYEDGGITDLKRRDWLVEVWYPVTEMEHFLGLIDAAAYNEFLRKLEDFEKSKEKLLEDQEVVDAEAK